MEKSKKSKLWMMVGIPGSGKSTYIKNMDCEDKNIISRDVIRFSMVKEDEDYFSKEKEVFNEFIRQIADSVSTHKNTFVDATHISKASRKKVLSRLTFTLANVEVNAIVMNVPLDVALYQNNKRTGRERVPESAIKNMFNQMTYPNKTEGFDHILFVK